MIQNLIGIIEVPAPITAKRSLSEHLLHRLTTLVEDDSGLAREQSIARIGLKYVDWQFDGDHIICVVRAAYWEAHNFHDANHIVFARIESLRQLSPAPAATARALRITHPPS